MAEILNRDERFWAVDKVVLAYLALTGALLVGFWNRVPAAGFWIAVHVVCAAVVVVAVKRAGRVSRIFRHWYPLLYVSICYREMSVLIPAIRGTDADAELAALDLRIWHANPTVWLERLQSPGLTECLQIVYSLFIPAVLFVAWRFWARQEYEAFRFYAFVIATGFLASYIGYFLVPARGPRFALRDLQHVPLQGMFVFGLLQSSLDKLESAAYDCFPSGHTELVILAWWGSRRLSKPLSWVYFVYATCIIFSTVYLRYHYTMDIVAGMLLAGVLVLATPALYRGLS
ncbi:MAG: phosphatase PAP2 family protein [Acidobacteriota bacterium]|nr:phosphatase PAP2 family protein [Acidobacteriota bacterium]MDP9115379.1 phosphatase PAP2 family protein [Acidobacteriota bacterium]